jgi:putative phage-type endonuclease
MEVFDCEQGSDEWKTLRVGLCTASNFSVIMAEGKDGNVSKTREDLLFDLVGERFTGEPAEDEFSSWAMERGKVMEAEARSFYEFTQQVTVKQVGFIRNTLPGTKVIVGCSPDGLVGKKKGLEIKTLKPRLLIRRYEKGQIMPTEHRAQVQGTMLVAELDEMDLMLFYRGMPKPMIFTVKRDEVYLKQLSNEIERFDHELRRLVQKHSGS